jgi:hypothetical protein
LPFRQVSHPQCDKTLIWISEKRVLKGNENFLEKKRNFQSCIPGLPDDFNFQAKNPNLVTFWRALEWKMLLYFMTIWNTLWPFDIIYGRLV